MPDAPTTSLLYKPKKMPAHIISIEIRDDKAEVLFKNGKKESYDLSVASQLQNFEKKYGVIPPPPPPPPAAYSPEMALAPPPPPPPPPAAYSPETALAPPPAYAPITALVAPAAYSAEMPPPPPAPPKLPDNVKDFRLSNDKANILLKACCAFLFLLGISYFMFS